MNTNTSEFCNLSNFSSLCVVNGMNFNAVQIPCNGSFSDFFIGSDALAAGLIGIVLIAHHSCHLKNVVQSPNLPKNVSASLYGNSGTVMLSITTLVLKIISFSIAINDCNRPNGVKRNFNQMLEICTNLKPPMNFSIPTSNCSNSAVVCCYGKAIDHYPRYSTGTLSLLSLLTIFCVTSLVLAYVPAKDKTEEPLINDESLSGRVSKACMTSKEVITGQLISSIFIVVFSATIIGWLFSIYDCTGKASADWQRCASNCT